MKIDKENQEKIQYRQNSYCLHTESYCTGKTVVTLKKPVLDSRKTTMEIINDINIC